MDWVLRMAWRDSRGRRGRLLLHTASIAVGIAALTGLRGLSRTMEENVDEQAAALMGADVEIESAAPFEGELRGIVDSLAALGGRMAEEAEMNSMVLFPASGGSRLARVRALQGGFPFYGELGTDPPEAAAAWQSGGMALVDDGMMLQYGVAVGDTIRVGRESLAIAGRLLNLPGETAFRSDLQPVVFMPLSRIGQTGLIQRGSRVRYRAHFQLPEGTDAAALAASLEERLERFDARIETVEDHKRRLGRTLRNLYRFLGLGSFVALLLGAVGVASAVHAHVEQKLETVAVLRSLGAASGAALRIYLVQAFAMGLIGSLGGAAAGTALLWRLPALLADFLPKELGELQAAPSLPAVGEGVAAGSAISLLFAALPLLAVRRVSPLLALRASYETEPARGDRLARALLLGLAAGATFLLAWALAGRPGPRPLLRRRNPGGAAAAGGERRAFCAAPCGATCPPPAATCCARDWPISTAPTTRPCCCWPVSASAPFSSPRSTRRRPPFSGTSTASPAASGRTWCCSTSRATRRKRPRPWCGRWGCRSCRKSPWSPRGCGR